MESKQKTQMDGISLALIPSTPSFPWCEALCKSGRFKMQLFTVVNVSLERVRNVIVYGLAEQEVAIFLAKSPKPTFKIWFYHGHPLIFRRAQNWFNGALGALRSYL